MDLAERLHGSRGALTWSRAALMQVCACSGRLLRRCRPLALTGAAIAVVATYLLVARTAATAGPDGVEIFMLIEGRQFFRYDEIADVVFVGKAVHASGIVSNPAK
jgi:hypothetical protein